MTKGLKQMVADATKTEKPVEISGEALRAFSHLVRRWSGWPDAKMVFGDPSPSPYASCDVDTHTFTANPETLVLNPNRVLLTVTPFRLRQEAILTGALLHEAGHARYSGWGHVTEHSDGTPVTKQVQAFARVMEEPRVEALIARDSARIGARGLDWTMRAMAAQCLPMTDMAADPNQGLIDFITSWALRAGRQHALAVRTGFSMREWANHFTNEMERVIADHLAALGVPDVATESIGVMDLLEEMMVCDDHAGPTMVDKARTVLGILFPETDPEEQPTAGGGCAQEQPEQGEEQPEQGESDEQESSEGEPQPEAGEPGEEPAEGEEEQPEGEGKPDEDEQQPEDEGEGAGGGDAESEDDQPEEDGATSSTEAEPEPNPLADVLRQMEADAAEGEETDADEEIDATPPPQTSGGSGDHAGESEGEWRMPVKAEREVQKGAEKFLRQMIDPSETAHVVLSESPSATVDPAAMASWKAGGMVRDPLFFKRTRRHVEPSPPVKIAVLVDVSMSMDSLQKPSALLSWALAAAALDLRNFAGRGQQIESCLIHWGSTAEVIQPNGKPLPGIREYGCHQLTYAMHDALDLVEQEMPGFLSTPEKPENRLLVQFTDWELGARNRSETHDKVHQVLAAGVNMLSVVPRSYTESDSDLRHIIRTAKVQRGVSKVLMYNPLFPSGIWDEASKMLDL